MLGALGRAHARVVLTKHVRGSRASAATVERGERELEQRKGKGRRGVDWWQRKCREGAHAEGEHVGRGGGQPLRARGVELPQ